MFQEIHPNSPIWSWTAGALNQSWFRDQTWKVYCMCSWTKMIWRILSIYIYIYMFYIWIPLKYRVIIKNKISTIYIYVYINKSYVRERGRGNVKPPLWSKLHLLIRRNHRVASGPNDVTQWNRSPWICSTRLPAGSEPSWAIAKEGCDEQDTRSGWGLREWW